MTTKVYLDTNVFIFLADENSQFFPSVSSLLKSRIDINCSLITSVLTRTEILSDPNSQKSDNRAFKVFDAFSDIQTLDMNSAIADLAAAIRKQTNLKTPDAIHGATAIESRASEFVTGDRAFKRLEAFGLKVTLLS